MQINNEIFEIVDLTAVGLLSEAAQILGMSFPAIKLAEIVLNNKIDNREELMASLKQLVDSNLLLLENDIYYVNSDYIIAE
ncbi:MAG: hypothetical protein WC656_01805 [Sulfurimonas sp.]|jgi:hypothetical protein